MTHGERSGFKGGWSRFFEHNVVWNQQFASSWSKKYRKKFENLLTHVEGCSIVNIGKGTRRFFHVPVSPCSDVLNPYTNRLGKEQTRTVGRQAG